MKFKHIRIHIYKYQDNLDDVLIFRLENGRDYFVTITGDYLKSCFGATADFLTTVPGPVRFASSSAPASKVITTIKI